MMRALEQSQSEHPMEWLILKALDTLCHERPYADVKVCDVCEQAGVSKPTFYRYFKSKGDVAKWHLATAGELGMHRIGRDLTVYEGVLATMRCMELVPSFHSRFDAFDRHDHYGAELYGEESVHDVLVTTLAVEKRAPLTEELDFQVRAAAGIMRMTLMRWKGDGYTHASRYAALCEACVPAPLRELLNGTPDTALGRARQAARDLPSDARTQGAVGASPAAW